MSGCKRIDKIHKNKKKTVPCNPPLKMSGCKRIHKQIIVIIIIIIITIMIIVIITTITSHKLFFLERKGAREGGAPSCVVRKWAGGARIGDRGPRST